MTADPESGIEWPAPSSSRVVTCLMRVKEQVPGTRGIAARGAASEAIGVCSSARMATVCTHQLFMGGSCLFFPREIHVDDVGAVLGRAGRAGRDVVLGLLMLLARRLGRIGGEGQSR